MLKQLIYAWKEWRGYDIPEKLEVVDEDGKINDGHNHYQNGEKL